MDLAPALIAVDEDIRAGRLVRARAQLRELLKKSLGRDVALRAAGLARRCGMPEQSLRLLAPTVRPSARSLVVASPDEIIEYAGALVAIGAHREALDLLASVPAARASEAALQRAFAHFAQWNYAAAIDCLQVYLRSDRIDAYRRLVGEVNLAAALVHERKDQPAQALLRRLLVQTEAPGFARLHANVLELAAQAAIERGAWTEATDYLERAQALLRGQGVRDAFYIEKWRAVLDLRRHPKSSPARRKLRALRKRAQLAGDAESVRDCDFHWVHATRSMSVARHLYCGTPYPAYRERLCADFGWSRSDFERGDYSWTLGRRPRTNCWLHLASGTHSGRGAALKPASALTLSLRALAQDFYGGLTLAALHGEVFPGRHYNPMSSPNVMHQILSRLREWLRRSGLPLEVVETGGFYSLVAPKGIILKVSGQHSVDPHRFALRTRFGQTFFSRQELAAELKLSARSAQRYVQELLRAGEVEAHGRARAMRYRLTA